VSKVSQLNGQDTYLLARTAYSPIEELIDQMSFAVETVAPVTVTSVPQPTAGSTVTSGTVAITDPNTASAPVTVGGNATAAIGTQNARVTLVRHSYYYNRLGCQWRSLSHRRHCDR